MSGSTRRISSLTKALLLFCLLCANGVQAAESWLTESSRYLEQLLESNPERLPELEQDAVLESYRSRQNKPLWSNEQGRLDRAYDLLMSL